MKSKYKIHILVVIFLICIIGIGMLIKKEKQEELDRNEEILKEEKPTLTDVPKVTQKPTQVQKPTDEGEKTNTEFQQITVEVGITILEIKSYAGNYMEDGSDEIVSNIMALQIKNDSDKAIQLADIMIVDKEGDSYEFRITTLLPGQKMLLLERNRAAYQSNMEVASVEINNLVHFSEELSLQTNMFEIKENNNLLTVKNISQEKIKKGRICFKNVIGNIYIGGITYSVQIPELFPGETVQIPVKHYTKDASEVVFVTYAK